MATSYIKEFSGHIIGIIETDANGNQTARDFESRKILGWYVKNHDHTENFMHQIVAKGNAVVNLIYEFRAAEEAKKKAEEAKKNK